MKYSTNLVIPLLFCISVPLHAKISVTDCGQGYDSIEGELRTTPFSKIRCDSRRVESETTKKIQIIDSYTETIKLLKIPYNKKFFRNYFVQKLFNNPYLNSYTLTIGVVEHKDVYENFVKGTLKDANITNTQKYGDSYIESVQSGGEHVVLYHIPTHSQGEYMTIYKHAQKYLHDPQSLQKFIDTLPPKTMQTIVVKEYFTKQLPAIPARNLMQSFQQSSYFEEVVQNHCLPYRYKVQRYQLTDTKDRKKYKERIKSKIDRLLNMQYFVNDYNYFRHHTDEFPHLDRETKNSLFNQSQRYKKNIMIAMQKGEFDQIELNIRSKKLPQRYNGYAGTRSLAVEDRNISLEINGIRYKPDPKTDIYFTLTSKIDIQNHGKLTRIKTRLAIRLKTLHEEKKETKILFDSYIDFPSLRFKNIQNNYGLLEFTLPFDKYTKEKELTGQGIIQKAKCGYDLNSDGKMKIYCKNIVYDHINIEFSHKE